MSGRHVLVDAEALKTLLNVQTRFARCEFCNWHHADSHADFCPVPVLQAALAQPTPAPAEALSREQLLNLLIQASEAAQNPGEEHAALAEQFMAVMTAPDTADLLRSILAALARAEAAEARVRELDRSDRFSSEMNLHDTLEEADAAITAHQAMMRSERQARLERQLLRVLQSNWQAMPYATPEGLAASLAAALAQVSAKGASHE